MPKRNTMKEIKTIPELWKWINNGYEGQYRVKSYYHCKAVEGSKSHKFEQYRSSGKPCYEFERIAQESRSKIFSFFLSSRVPKTFSDKARERMAYVITNNHNISGIVKPQGITSTNPHDKNVWYGYGDVLPRGRGGERLLDYSHGEDMLIFKVANDLSQMEIYLLDVRAISESRPQDRPRAYKGKKQNIPRTDILQLFVKGRFDREVRNLRRAAYYLKKNKKQTDLNKKILTLMMITSKMYDTIKMQLTPLYLDRGYMCALLKRLDYYEPKTDKQKGWRYFKGSIKNMGVTADDYRGVKIYGSLPKYHHGNNITDLNRAEVEQAINELSEQLHLPLEQAKVLRLDIGANIEVTNPVEMYLPYLGVLPRWQRELHTAKNLYYHGGGGTQVMEFYDKVADLKVKDKTLFLEYESKHILRAELRYLYRLGTRFNQPVTGTLLYEPNFYNSIVDRWGANVHGHSEKQNN